MHRDEALDMMEHCFLRENEGMHRARKIQVEAIESYQNYLSDISYLWKSNRELSIMKKNSLMSALSVHRKAFSNFKREKLNG